MTLCFIDVRERWVSQGLPSVGVCGDISQSDGGRSGTSVTSWSGGEPSVYITCTWVISLSSQKVLLLQIPPDNTTPG